MRLLRGGSLEAALEQGPWKTEAATRLVDQIVAALATAHRQGADKLFIYWAWYAAMDSGLGEPELGK